MQVNQSALLSRFSISLHHQYGISGCNLLMRTPNRLGVLRCGLQDFDSIKLLLLQIETFEEMVALFTSFYFFRDYSEELSIENERELFITRIMFIL